MQLQKKPLPLILTVT